MRLSWFLLLAGLVGCAGEERTSRDFESAREAQVAALTAGGAPESLATASMMRGLKRDTESLALINGAAALAPERAEIIYLQWRVCVSHQCAEEAQILAALKRVDPGNGMAWLPQLNGAWERGDQAEVTDIVAKIGASRGLNLYWNSSTVMMADALSESGQRKSRGHANDLPARMVTAIGILAAVSIPPLQPLGRVCLPAQFEQRGRRAACEAMVAGLGKSDTIIVQSLGLSIQEKWWPEGSAERESLKGQRQQIQYLLIASSRERILHLNKDFATRLDAMRRTSSEAEVMRAMLISYHEPLERPLTWKDPFAAKNNSQTSN